MLVGGLVQNRSNPIADTLEFTRRSHQDGLSL